MTCRLTAGPRRWAKCTQRGGGTGATVSGTDISTEGERPWAGSVSAETIPVPDDKYSVYGEVLANRSLESIGESNNYSATGCIRMK